MYVHHFQYYLANALNQVDVVTCYPWVSVMEMEHLWAGQERELLLRLMGLLQYWELMTLLRMWVGDQQDQLEE